MGEDPLPDPVTVDLGQHEIEHHHVVCLVLEEADRCSTRPRLRRPMTRGREDVDEDAAQRRFVLHHEDPGAPSGHG